jgi:hypothetical protein
LPRRKYLIRLADWNLAGLVYWLHVDGDVKKLEGAGLNWCELGIEFEDGVWLGVDRHGVSGDGGEVAEERAEAMDGNPSSVRWVAALRWAAAERFALMTMEVRAALALALSWSSNRTGLSAWRMCYSR